jgi:hypothetical protein
MTGDIYIDETTLNNDTQSQKEKDQAFNTTLTLFSCNV